MNILLTPILCLILTSGYAVAQTGTTVRLQPDVIVRLPAGAGLAAIADGDFNHDGRRDLAVLERNLGEVALYMRSAAGTYPKAKFTYAVGQYPTGLVSFNRERGLYHADLMALSGPSALWTMLRDDLDTTGFLVQRPLPGFFNVSEITLRPVLVQADVDQNGVADFAFTYPIRFNSFLRYDRYSSDINPPIKNKQYYDARFLNTVRKNPPNLTLADFNLNGTLDAVVADSADNAVRIITDFQIELSTIETSGRGPVQVSAQDIDGDQIPDLAVAYAGSNEVTIFRATTTYGFNRAYSYFLPASPRRVLLVDLNRDFFPELLVVTANNELRMYQHNGTASALCYTTIPPQILATGVNPSILQVMYVNEDAAPDIIVGCAGDNTIHTYLNRTGTVTTTQASRPLLNVNVYPSPATTSITVRQATPARLQATLLDQLGRPVLQQTVTQQTTAIATADLPRGLYLLRLVGDAGARTVRVVLE